MAAIKKLEADFLNTPFLSVNKIAFLVLSILNSGIKIKPPVLKLADKVVEKIFPPSKAPLNTLYCFSSPNNSVRSVRPSQGFGL